MNITQNPTNYKQASEIADALSAKKSGNGYLARCVSHADKNPSLSISQGSGDKVLVKCHAGCSQEAVINKLTEMGLWFGKETKTHEKRREEKNSSTPYRVVATYFYKDENGNDVIKVLRMEASGRPKTFIPYYYDGQEWKLGGTKHLKKDLPPYRYQEWKDFAGPVFLVEGEKCSDFLASKGFKSTTTPGGSGQWKETYAPFFQGKDVVVIPDNDEPGLKYANAVIKSLTSTAKSIKLINLPGLSKAEDVIDWAKKGGSKDKLLELVSKTEQLSKDGLLKDDNLVKFSDVQAEIVDWLWYPYVPKNKATIIEGDPGIGKSFITLALASALSKGHPLPGSDKPTFAKTLMFNSEDGLGDTLKPRLKAMGADDSQIYSYKIPLVLDDVGKQIIINAVKTIKPALVTLDPLSAVIGSGVDMYRANEVRPFMTFLGQLAEEHNCAVVVVRHLTKGGKDSAIHRGAGSIDFIGACRSALLVGCDPDDRTNKALVHIKSNLAPFGDSLGYTIEGGRFLWTGKSSLTSSRILSPAAKEEDSSALTEAEDFLKEYLGSGAQSAIRVESGAEIKGISKATLRRACHAMNIVKFREGEAGKKGGGKWIWRLPDLDAQNDLDAQDSRTENLSTLILKPHLDAQNENNLSTLISKPGETEHLFDVGVI